MTSLTRLLWRCRSVYTLNVVLMVAIFITFLFTYGMKGKRTVVSHQAAINDGNKIKRDIISSLDGFNDEELHTVTEVYDVTGYLDSLHPDIKRRMKVLAHVRYFLC